MLVLAFVILSLMGHAVDFENLPAESIYQLQQNWILDSGKKITIQDLKGKPRILTFIFSRCPGACPLTVQHIENIRRQLSPEKRKLLHITLVTLDVVNDSPENLNKFRQKMKLDDSYELLYGSANDVRLLAVALGFQYKELSDGTFSHATTLYLLDEVGRVKLQRDESIAQKDFVSALK